LFSKIRTEETPIHERQTRRVRRVPAPVPRAAARREKGEAERCCCCAAAEAPASAEEELPAPALLPPSPSSPSLLLNEEGVTDPAPCLARISPERAPAAAAAAEEEGTAAESPSPAEAEAEAPVPVILLKNISPLSSLLVSLPPLLRAWIFGVGAEGGQGGRKEAWGKSFE